MNAVEAIEGPQEQGLLVASHVESTGPVEPSRCHDNRLATDVTFTVFDDVSARVKKERTRPWPEIVGILSSPKQYPSKEACPLLKLCTFGDEKTGKGCLRNDDNLIEIYGVEGDYDGERVTIDQASEMLEANRIEAFIYSSASHNTVTHDNKGRQRSGGGPRWRVLAPLSRPHTRQERSRLVAMLNWTLGGILSNESFTPSQTFYFGKVKDVPYETRHIEGLTLDDPILAIVLGETYPESGRGHQDTLMPFANDDLSRQVALSEITERTVAELHSTLSYFTIEDADSYPFWIEFGHAIASLKGTQFENEGRDIWHGLSAKSPRYDHDETEAKWEEISPSKITYRSIFEWASNRGWANPRNERTAKTVDEYFDREDQTDTGNANLLIRLTEGNLRYVPERHLWLWWDGSRWVADEHGSCAHMAALRVAHHYHNKAARLLQEAADQAHDAEGRKKLEKASEALSKWEKHCRNKRTIDNMLATAAKDSRLKVRNGDLDRDPWLLGVANGVVDLRTGTLRSAAREDLVTKHSPVEFVSGAEAARWRQFIAEITAKPMPEGGAMERLRLADYLQRALGYSMTGSTAEHKMFIAIGAGANGKNVLLDIFHWVLGGYSQHIQPEALMATRHDNDAERPSPTAASLAGARVAISSESKDGQKLDVALVKRHTGGGFMTARFMRENKTTFEITHKLWMMTNHRPTLDHLDDAMRGRLHLIPFDRSWNRPGHPDRDPSLPEGDKDLPQKLKAEAAGILAWLVAGAVAYGREGLDPPVEVARMTRDYFNDQDAVGRWLDLYTPCEPKGGASASELFQAFQHWCQQEDLHDARPMSQKAFSMKLKGRGIEHSPTSKGSFYGLRPLGGAEFVEGEGS